jgi:hypothetical protein
MKVLGGSQRGRNGGGGQGGGRLGFRERKRGGLQCPRAPLVKVARPGQPAPSIN